MALEYLARAEAEALSWADIAVEALRGNRDLSRGERRALSKSSALRETLRRVETREGLRSWHLELMAIDRVALQVKMGEGLQLYLVTFTHRDLKVFQPVVAPPDGVRHKLVRWAHSYCQAVEPGRNTLKRAVSDVLAGAGDVAGIMFLESGTAKGERVYHHHVHALLWMCPSTAEGIRRSYSRKFGFCDFKLVAGGLADTKALDYVGKSADYASKKFGTDLYWCATVDGIAGVNPF